MTNTQIQRLARNQSIRNYSYTWSQGRRHQRANLSLLAVVIFIAAVLMFLPGCDSDPTPAPQPAAAEQPARDFPLCGNHSILCR